MKDYQCLKGMIEDSKSKLMTAYDKGYKKGQEDNADWVSERANDIGQAWYNKGVRDLYSAIVRIVSHTEKGLKYTELKEIFGISSTSEIIDSYEKEPQLLIENIKEYEERKKQEEEKPATYCGFIDMMCPYKIPCVSCDVQKAHKAATAKAKENDNA